MNLTCEQWRRRLPAYLDGELGTLPALEIEEHLAACAGCAAERDRLLALRQALRSAAPSLRFAAPAGLTGRVRASVREAAGVEEPTPSRAPRERAPWWPILGFDWRWLASSAAFATALVALLALAGVFFSRLPFRPNDVAAERSEIFSAHVRSLLVDHLTDVASTDQHTVKPWFNGRLDFSPPVIDLAPVGFPLVGGRLDFLNGRPAAALVYRSDRHPINVFVQPSAASPDAGKNARPEKVERDGYCSLCWSAAGLTFHAVSDVNATDLHRFTDELRARLARATE